MKRIRLALAACMVAYVAMSAGIGAQAGGVGACVLGNGAAIDAQASPAFVGVNIGQNSETNVFTTKEDYEAQCCAETNQPPDCFQPVGTGN